MHQFSRFLLILLITLIFSNPSLNTFAQCVNPNVENGDFTGWKGFQLRNLPSFGLTFRTPVTLPYSNRSQIKTAGFDPIINTLPMVMQGNHSIRLGDDAGGRNADSLVYSFKVDQSNKKFAFCYALVLQEPGHHKEDQPYFRYRITVGGKEILYKKIVATRTDPYLKAQGGVVYKNWDCVCDLDLSRYIGQTAQIEFLVADCRLGEHFAYAYIDGICLNPGDMIESAFTLQKNEYCLKQSIIADGTPSKNESDFFWSIEESDSNGGRPNPASEKSKWFTQQAGPIDLESLYRELGGTWKCDTYYRVKLAVKNSCIPWKETVKLIKANCLPEINLLPDQCCLSAVNNGVTVSANSTNYAKYEWEPEDAFNNPDQPNPPVDLSAISTYPFSFLVTITDQKGCKLTKGGTVYCGPPVFEIKKTDGCCAGTTLSVVGKNAAEYLWSTGEKSSSIFVTKPGTYSVKVSNPCDSSTQSINVQPINPQVTGNFPIVVYGNNFSRSGQPLTVTNYYVPTLPINATAYRITVYSDAKGSSIIGQEERYASSQGACTTFNPGEITWNGSLNGVRLAAGMYFWRLEFKNCSYDWTVVTRHKQYWVCDQYRWPKFFGCKTGHYAEINTATNEPDLVIVL